MSLAGVPFAYMPSIKHLIKILRHLRIFSLLRDAVHSGMKFIGKDRRIQMMLLTKTGPCMTGERDQSKWPVQKIVLEDAHSVATMSASLLSLPTDGDTDGPFIYAALFPLCLFE